jgi:hypothetical protein
VAWRFKTFDLVLYYRNAGWYLGGIAAMLEERMLLV